MNCADGKVGGKKVVVVGAGNIGLPLLGYVVRMVNVGRVVCVEPDTFEAGNCLTQNITRRDVGLPKAVAAARQMRQIRGGDVEIIPMVARVQDVPWGLLRCDVICACVDNREARAAINTIAWRLGVPWIDAGIRAEGLLARVSVFVPGRDVPCLECAWGEQDYANMAQSYSCGGVRKQTPPTGAQASLGGLAASVQAMECQKILEGRMDQSLAGRQVIIEAAYHHHYITVLRRRTDCRFDHGSYGAAGQIGADATVEQLCEMGGGREGAPLALRVEGQNWVTRLACPQCADQTRVLRLQGRMKERGLRCVCGGRRAPVGFHLKPRLVVEAGRASLRRQRLAALGLAAGDIVHVEGEQGERLVELVGA